MKRKLISVILSAAMASVMLAGCSGSSSSTSASSDESSGEAQAESSASSDSGSASSGASIELAYNLAAGEDEFNEIIQEWAQQSGVTVEVTCAGEDHESTMKTRMASGDLPDIWLTHGWSVNRYGEYLTDLSDQEWVADIDSGLKDVITTDDGEIYILPLSQSVACCVYNADVLEEAGVDPADIRTWDDFSDACQAVLDNTDADPIMTSLGDESLDSYLLEVIWPTYLSNSDAVDYSADALLDGSFDWTSEKGKSALEMIAGWYDAGYFNEDLVSCKRDDIARVMASNGGAFCFFACDLSNYIFSYNADANLGYLPLPSSSDDGTSYFALGEGNYGCFGIWCDTKYPDECKDLLNYLAEPEIATQIVKIDGGIPAMNYITLEEGTDAARSYTMYQAGVSMFEGDISYDNFFDREYLPSGMWSCMQEAVDTLLADGNPDDQIDNVASYIQTQYDDLMTN